MISDIYRYLGETSIAFFTFMLAIIIIYILASQSITRDDIYLELCTSYHYLESKKTFRITVNVHKTAFNIASKHI